MKDSAYRKEYDALEDEFALIAAVAKARIRAGLSQTQLAKRMKTTQSTIARPTIDPHALPLCQGHRASAEDQF